jgi:pimeloyl-ACP methyl ester carboxylesterase
MAVFRRGGFALHYLVRGAGESVLLIRDLGTSGAEGAFQVPALEPRFRVIVPDLAGSGHSGAAYPPTSSASRSVAN